MRQEVIEALRVLAVRASSRPALRWGCQRLYDGAFRAATACLRGEQGVRAILLRRFEEGRSWAPGLSDLDFTVLMNEKGGGATLAFLDRFWRRYARLKQAVPMLGEVDVLTPRDFVDYLTLGPGPTAPMKVHEMVFDRLDGAQAASVRDALGRQGAAVTGSDILRDGLLRYLRHALPRALEWLRRPGELREALLVHVLSNVDRRLARLRRLRGADAGERGDGRREALQHLVEVFRNLSEECRLYRAAVKDGTRPRLESVGEDAPDRPWRECAPELSSLLGMTPSSHGAVILWRCFMLDQPTVALVIEDEVSYADLVRLFKGLARIHEARYWHALRNDPVEAQFPGFSYPVLVSRSIWSAWLRLLPFDGAAVATRSRVAAGDESVIEAAPATLAEFRRAVAVQYVALLSLRNNWRGLSPVDRPALYRVAHRFLHGYRSALAGGPVCTAPGSCPVMEFDLKDHYERLSQGLSELRGLLGQTTGSVPKDMGPIEA